MPSLTADQGVHLGQRRKHCYKSHRIRHVGPGDDQNEAQAELSRGENQSDGENDIEKLAQSLQDHTKALLEAIKEKSINPAPQSILLEHQSGDNDRQPVWSQQREQSSNRQEGLCYYCNQPGHLMRDCRQKEYDDGQLDEQTGKSIPKPGGGQGQMRGRYTGTEQAPAHADVEKLQRSRRISPVNRGPHQRTTMSSRETS